MTRRKKERPTLKESLEGWLAFNGYWFWRPESGLFGSCIMVLVALAVILAWGMWR